MIYEILDDEGNVVNTIVATIDFVQQQYGEGKYRAVDDPPPPPPPPLPKEYTRLQLINVLDSDYNTIVTSSKTDVEIEVWLEKFRLQDKFVVDNTGFINDINFLVTKTLITQEKANTILS